MKRFLSLSLAFSLLISVGYTAAEIKAAAIKLNKTALTLTAGSSSTLKVKGTKAKVKWTSSKKSVATVSSSGFVNAKTSGSTTITAKVSGKKLRCTVTVRAKNGKGTKASPKSAYCSNTFTYYEEGKKKGRFTMKLIRFESGESAALLAKGNSTNPVPASNQEYIYFKFQIKYISGTQTIEAKDIFNYYYNIYGLNSTKQLTNLDWGFYFEPVDDLGQITLSPGNNVICSKAILVEKGNSPITYRIQTGKSSYTWFTTA
jgi:hypothetical protein